MSEPVLFSYRVKVDDIPERGQTLQIEAPEEVRRAIAQDFGLVALSALKAELALKRKGKDVVVTGRLEAQLTQTCVVSLDPFEESVQEELDLRFAPDVSLIHI